jgi:hypothetical protein
MMRFGYFFGFQLFHLAGAVDMSYLLPTGDSYVDFVFRIFCNYRRLSEYDIPTTSLKLLIPCGQRDAIFSGRVSNAEAVIAFLINKGYFPHSISSAYSFSLCRSQYNPNILSDAAINPLTMTFRFLHNTVKYLNISRHAFDFFHSWCDIFGADFIYNDRRQVSDYEADFRLETIFV